MEWVEARVLLSLTVGLAGRAAGDFTPGWLASVLCVGPRPSMMMARESGVSLVCQPWSAWYLSMAASVWESHCPLGVPSRYFSRISALWISVARSGSIVRWPCGVWDFLDLCED